MRYISVWPFCYDDYYPVMPGLLRSVHFKGCWNSRKGGTQILTLQKWGKCTGHCPKRRMNGYCPLGLLPSASLVGSPATPVQPPSPTRGRAQAFRRPRSILWTRERSPQTAAWRSGAPAPFWNSRCTRWRQACPACLGRGPRPRRPVGRWSVA